MGLQRVVLSSAEGTLSGNRFPLVESVKSTPRSLPQSAPVGREHLPRVAGDLLGGLARRGLDALGRLGQHRR